MLYSMFSVFDKTAAVYMQPFCSRTAGEAVRSFRDGVNTPGTPMFTASADFSLFKVGIFDDVTGTVQSFDTAPVLIVHGSEVRER